MVLVVLVTSLLLGIVILGGLVVYLIIDSILD